MRNAFNRVRLRSIGVEEEIYGAEGGLLASSQFAKTLGLRSRQSVSSYRQTKKIFALSKRGRYFLYPAWQVHKGTLLPWLAETLSILETKKVPPMAVALFFLTPAAALDGSRPLDLLRRGKHEEVVQHAERYGEMGA